MKLLVRMAIFLVAASSVFAGEMKWENNCDRGIELAKKEKKLVMLDIYTHWCSWRKRLDRDVYSRKEVQDKLAKDFVTIKFDLEKSTPNDRLCERFGLDGFPSVVFLNSEGKKLAEVVGYLPPAEFLKRLDDVVKQTR